MRTRIVDMVISRLETNRIERRKRNWKGRAKITENRDQDSVGYNLIKNKITKNRDLKTVKNLLALKAAKNRGRF
jgi:hypothetical protein